MEYKIVEASDSYDLAARVNDLLAKGWELQGGVSVAQVAPFDATKETFAQAMILRK